MGEKKGLLGGGSNRIRTAKGNGEKGLITMSHSG